MWMIIAAILLLSINNILWKKNLAEHPLFFLIACRAFFTSSIALAGFFIFQGNMPVSFEMIGRISLGASLGVIGLFCMLSILQVQSLQWVAIYNLLGILLSSIYLWMFEDTTLDYGYGGVFLIVTGYLLFVYFNADDSGFRIDLKSHLLLFVMTLSFGFMGIIQWKNVTNDTPSLIILATQELMVFGAALIAFIFLKNEPVNLKSAKTILPKAFLMSLIILFALYLSLLGTKATSPVVSGLLFLANPITTILFSAIYFKETIYPKNILALFILCSGAFLLHLSQP